MVRMASADIICVGPKSQDVRATEIDKVAKHASFCLGDIVRALVAYYLSAAEIEVGVVSAGSAAGGKMVSISWGEMQRQLTRQVELRKIAKFGA